VDGYGRVAGGSFPGFTHVVIRRMHARRFGGEGGGVLQGCRSGAGRYIYVLQDVIYTPPSPKGGESH
jgi:hypothetical protein